MVNFETIQDWYNRGWMTEEDVNQFLALGAITKEQANAILDSDRQVAKDAKGTNSRTR